MNAKTTVKKCAEIPPTTPTTYTTTPTTHTTTPTTHTTTPTTHTTTPTTHTTTTTTHTTTPSQPTICPYGEPTKVFMRNIRANNYLVSKPVIAEITPNAQTLSEEVEYIITPGDETPEILAPHPIAKKYSNALNKYLYNTLPRTRSATSYAVIFKT